MSRLMIIDPSKLLSGIQPGVQCRLALKKYKSVFRDQMYFDNTLQNFEQQPVNILKAKCFLRKYEM